MMLGSRCVAPVRCTNRSSSARDRNRQPSGEKSVMSRRLVCERGVSTRRQPGGRSCSAVGSAGPAAGAGDGVGAAGEVDR